MQASGSHDLSIRLWERTAEPLVLSEQQELVSQVKGWESVGKGLTAPLYLGKGLKNNNDSVATLVYMLYQNNFEKLVIELDSLDLSNSVQLAI